jgi:hypothetical protein
MVPSTFNLSKAAIQHTMQIFDFRLDNDPEHIQYFDKMSLLICNIIIFVETFVETFSILLSEVRIEPVSECTKVDSIQRTIIELKNLS